MFWNGQFDKSRRNAVSKNVGGHAFPLSLIADFYSYDIQMTNAQSLFCDFVPIVYFQQFIVFVPG